jgi:hypothetical protein
VTQWPESIGAAYAVGIAKIIAGEVDVLPRCKMRQHGVWHHPRHCGARRRARDRGKRCSTAHGGDDQGEPALATLLRLYGPVAAGRAMEADSAREAFRDSPLLSSAVACRRSCGSAQAGERWPAHETTTDDGRSRLAPARPPSIEWPPAPLLAQHVRRCRRAFLGPGTKIRQGSGDGSGQLPRLQNQPSRGIPTDEIFSQVIICRVHSVSDMCVARKFMRPRRAST